VKTFLTRTFSLIVCVVAATAVFWIFRTLSFTVPVAAVASAASLGFCWQFQSRTVPLLFCIEVGTALSWASIYAFWFAVWMFHSVTAMRVCDAVGSFILLPSKWVFELLGGDQSTILSDPTSFWGTNGLIVGILLYCAFRAVLNRREAAKGVEEEPARARRIEAKLV